MLYHPFFLSDRSYHICRFLNKYDSYHIIFNEVLVELEYDILTSSNLVIMNRFYDFAYILFSCRRILHLDYKIPYEQLEFILLLSIEKKTTSKFWISNHRISSCRTRKTTPFFKLLPNKWY